LILKLWILSQNLQLFVETVCDERLKIGNKPTWKAAGAKIHSYGANFAHGPFPYPTL